MICGCWLFLGVQNQKISHKEDFMDAQLNIYIAGYYVFRIDSGKIKLYWAEIQTILFEAEHTVNVLKIRYIRSESYFRSLCSVWSSFVQLYHWIYC